MSHERRGRVTCEIISVLKETLARMQPNNNNLSPASDKAPGRKAENISPKTLSDPTC